jgi:signal peptidase I
MRTRDGDAATRKRRSLPVWAETVVLLVLALVVSAVVKTFFVQMFFVPSGSMRPLFVEDDRILVQKISYWSGDVQRGDVVVFDDPGGRWLGSEGPKLSPMQKVLTEVGLYPTGGHLVKRVIGVGGDHVVCCDKQHRVTVNGVPLQEKSYIM